MPEGSQPHSLWAGSRAGLTGPGGAERALFLCFLLPLFSGGGFCFCLSAAGLLDSIQDAQ